MASSISLEVECDALDLGRCDDLQLEGPLDEIEATVCSETIDSTEIVTLHEGDGQPHDKIRAAVSPAEMFNKNNVTLHECNGTHDKIGTTVSLEKMRNKDNDSSDSHVVEAQHTSDPNPVPSKDDVHNALMMATQYAHEIFNGDGCWEGEVRCDTTFTAQYVFLRQCLDLGFDGLAEDFISWFLGQQQSDGSFTIAAGIPGNVSGTTESYLALKILGVPASHPSMLKARNWLLNNGGIAKVRNFTRFFLACFGLISWSSIPALAPETILFHDKLPFSVYGLAFWARLTTVPMFLISHHRPLFALPNGRFPNNDFLDELWVNKALGMPGYGLPITKLVRSRNLAGVVLTIGDRTMKLMDPILRRTPVRKFARGKVVQWLLARQDESGEVGGIFPATWGLALGLFLEGYPVTDGPIQKALAHLKNALRRSQGGLWIQSTNSAIWDTALMFTALSDSNVGLKKDVLERSSAFLLSHQITGTSFSDWKHNRPFLTGGSWAFQSTNQKYPDNDDTACVVVALLAHMPQLMAVPSFWDAARWLVGMQNPDGGWGGFEWKNNHQFLNDHPAADIKEMCDPSCADVTGHVLEALGTMLSHPCITLFPVELRQRMYNAAEDTMSYLLNTQEEFGGWYGRWNINYIWGTSNVLCGLGYFRNSHQQMQTPIKKAISWLKSVQNEDGGWGESVLTYDDPKLAGTGATTPTQTAWALMGLLAHLPPSDWAIIKGVHWLLQNQSSKSEEGATWEQMEPNGTGFPGWLYIHYTLYPTYFPMMALGRYNKATNLESSQARMAQEAREDSADANTSEEIDEYEED